MPVSKDPEKRAAWLKVMREKAITKHGAYHANFIENIKRCKQCEKMKTIANFSKQSKSFDGLDYICKTCHAENARKRRIPVPRKKREEYIIPAEKVCRKCYKLKPIEDYGPSPRNRDKHAGACLICSAANRRLKQKKTTSLENLEKALKYDYRLTVEEYNQKLAAQNGVCTICGKPETLIDKRTNKTRRLAIDHNHQTGEIRDLLCHRCNQVYGRLEEDPELIKALLAYAERWKAI